MASGASGGGLYVVEYDPASQRYCVTLVAVASFSNSRRGVWRPVIDMSFTKAKGNAIVGMASSVVMYRTLSGNPDDDGYQALSDGEDYENALGEHPVKIESMGVPHTASYTTRVRCADH